MFNTTNMPRYIYDEEYSGAIDRDDTSIGLVPFQSSAGSLRPTQRTDPSQPRTPPPTQSLGTRVIATEGTWLRLNAVDMSGLHQQPTSGRHDSGVVTPSPPPPRNKSTSSTRRHIEENGRMTVNYDALFEPTSLLTYQYATAESIQRVREESERQIESRTVVRMTEELEVADKESKRKRLKTKCARLWAKVKFPETWGPG
jgi:hypothetical protein